MSNVELMLGLFVLLLVGSVLLAPFIILRSKNVTRLGERALFVTTGSVEGLSGRSMIPLYRFDVFLSGLHISGLFHSRFISVRDLSSIAEKRKLLGSFIELKLECGEIVTISSNNSEELIGQLTDMMKQPNTSQ